MSFAATLMHGAHGLIVGYLLTPLSDAFGQGQQRMRQFERKMCLAARDFAFFSKK
jgi:hypothetical protein